MRRTSRQVNRSRCSDSSDYSGQRKFSRTSKSGRICRRLTTRFQLANYAFRRLQDDITIASDDTRNYRAGAWTYAGYEWYRCRDFFRDGWPPGLWPMSRLSLFFHGKQYRVQYDRGNRSRYLSRTSSRTRRRPSRQSNSERRRMRSFRRSFPNRSITGRARNRNRKLNSFFRRVSSSGQHGKLRRILRVLFRPLILRNRRVSRGKEGRYRNSDHVRIVHQQDRSVQVQRRTRFIDRRSRRRRHRRSQSSLTMFQPWNFLRLIRRYFSSSFRNILGS